MKISHLVKVYFHRNTPTSWETDYFERRGRLFEKFTVRSLLAQEFKDFRVWIHCSAGMEQDVSPFSDRHPEFVFTFGEHFPSSLVQGSDYVYVTRIDSDDVYRKDALAIVNGKYPSQAGEVEALMFRKGFIYDIRDGRLGYYENPSQPFHTVMFPASVFSDPVAYEKEFVGDHSKVASKYPVQILPAFRFCVLLHGLNCGSTFENRGATMIDRRDFTVEGFIDGSFDI